MAVRAGLRGGRRAREASGESEFDPARIARLDRVAAAPCCHVPRRCGPAARAVKNVGNKKARSRMNRLRACSLPHVGMRADREGSVIGFARCTAKQNLPVHLKRCRVDRAENAKTLRHKACYRCQGEQLRAPARARRPSRLEPEQAGRVRFAPNRIPPVPTVAGAMCAWARWRRLAGFLRPPPWRRPGAARTRRAPIATARMRRDDAIAFAKPRAAPTLHPARHLVLGPNAAPQIGAICGAAFAQPRTSLQTRATTRCVDTAPHALSSRTSFRRSSSERGRRRYALGAAATRAVRRGSHSTTDRPHIRAPHAYRIDRGAARQCTSTADPAQRPSAARASAPPCRDGTLHANRGSA